MASLRRAGAAKSPPLGRSAWPSVSASAPASASTPDASAAPPLPLSIDLDDWAVPPPSRAAKSPPWTPGRAAELLPSLFPDALLLPEADPAWLGDGLHYEPDAEPAAVPPLEPLRPATPPVTPMPMPAGCGSAGGCGGGGGGGAGGAQFADMEALLAAGGCCRGEAGASSCCRVAKAGPEPASAPAPPSVPAVARVPTALPAQPPTSAGCGCGDGSCSSDGDLARSSKATDADGGSSSESAASSSGPGTTMDGGAKPSAAPRTRKRRSHLSPEERAAVRREQHRETMRRSRQRFRDKVDAMKATVERLEAVKARAMGSTGAAADAAALRDQLAFLEREEQQLVHEKRALHAQVVQSLQEIVARHPSSFRASGRDLDLLALGSDRERDRERGASDELTLCDFVTWDVATVGHCLALVRDSYADISQFYAAIDAAPAGHDAYGAAHVGAAATTAVHGAGLFRSGLELMGWRDHRRFRGNDTCLEFAFEKEVPAAHARELFVKTWLFCRDQRALAGMLAPAAAALELEVLHEIHDDLVVVRRVHQEPASDATGGGATKFRSIDLLYRIDAVDEGDAGGWSYVVLRSVNPSFVRACGCAGNAWFDSYMWFGFAPAAGGSRVRFGGTLDGHSRAFALRWMLSIFFVLLRWESANVAPLLIVS